MRAEGYAAIAGDATDFSLDEAFDFIVAGEVIEHLPCPGKFLACALRHLKPGGELILTCPNANCLLYFIENCLLGYELDNSDHVSLFTPTTLRVMLRKCGFEAKSFHFAAENLAHYQPTAIRRFVAIAMWLVQYAAGLVRPSLCRHFITIAKAAEVPA